MSNLRPRLCSLEKGPSGYGFHLHGEKGKTGQFIRLVEPDSPAAASGLRAGDLLVFVNGQRVEGECHQHVVDQIRATAGTLRLTVMDRETAELLKKHSLQCREEFVTEGVPVPGSDGTGSPVPGQNGEASPERGGSSKEGKADFRPRLCHMKKGANGYGFNLHSEKNKTGQYIRAVDEDSPAQRAGLRAHDKIVQVNSMSVVGMQHSDVVAAIKAGGEQTSLLVVDPEADAFFNSCSVLPAEEHLTGPLPEPVSGRAPEEDKVQQTVSESQSTSSTSSNASLPTASTSTPLPEVESSPKFDPEADSSPALELSLAQVKEKARQKRSAKKAPPMDWSKRNELFSNL